MAKKIPLNTNIKRCPNGKELMIDAIIPITYAGGGPYIHRKPGKQVSLGHGSYMAALEILSTRFGFKTTLTAARSVVGYMGNVSDFHGYHNNKFYCHHLIWFYKLPLIL